MLSKEYRDHFIAISESLRPILIVEVSLNVFFRACLVLFDNEFIERVLKDTLEDPLAENLKVWLCAFLQEEFKKVSDRLVRGVDH